jgi:hypothetical protein
MKLKIELKGMHCGYGELATSKSTEGKVLFCFVFSLLKFSNRLI